MKYIYAEVNRSVPRFIKFDTPGVRIRRFLCICNRRIETFKEDIAKQVELGEVSKNLNRNINREMDKYREWMIHVQDAYYYKMWLIRQAVPYDLYQLIGSYYSVF